MTEGTEKGKNKETRRGKGDVARMLPLQRPGVGLCNLFTRNKEDKQNSICTMVLVLMCLYLSGVVSAVRLPLGMGPE